MQPQRALVRPRVYSPCCGEALPLDDEIRGLREAWHRGAVRLVGPAGSGKTAALAYLAAQFPKDANILLCDEAASPVHTPVSLVIYAATAPASRDCLNYRLAPWGLDEFLEYLQVVHPTCCGSVLQRLANRDRGLFAGLPEVWRPVLDYLALNAHVPDARSALRGWLQTQLQEQDLLERARSVCLNLVLATPAEEMAQEQLAQPGFPAELMRVLRHRPVQLELAAERIAADLHAESPCEYLGIRVPRDLVHAVAKIIGTDGRALSHLHRLLAGPAGSHAMAASLLHATEAGWVPVPGVTALAGAYLEGLRWRRAPLARASLDGADFRGADLSESDLDHACAIRACFHAANLQGARMARFRADEADLADANLSGIRAEESSWLQTNLEGARLKNATLRGCFFVAAYLKSANFRGADLTGADLREAQIEGAVFAGADLRGANLTGLRLAEAQLAGGQSSRCQAGRM